MATSKKGSVQPVTPSDLKVQLDRIEGELARSRTWNKQIIWLVPLQVGCSFVIAGGAAWWRSLWTLTAVALGFALIGYSWWKIAQLRKG